MSRIGKKSILIPAGVSVSEANSIVSVKGAKGSLTLSLRPEVAVDIADKELSVVLKSDAKGGSAFWGLTRALLANMVLGVSEGFEKKLELVGVGYRAKAINNSSVSLSLGFSHPIEFVAPAGVDIVVEDVQKLTIRGIDKHLVGLTAAKIKKLRKPEPYKGKGIKYAGEVIRRKAGKSGKV